MALWEDILRNLINVLPDVYNKEVKDLNYYRYLEVLAKELADVQQEIQTVDQNGFLDEATGDALYNNFGVLVNLPRKSNWTDEQYRGILRGVMNALLKGPSPQTIKESIKLFTSFDSEVYELYKDYDKIDPSYAKDASIPYSFLVKINKDIDVVSDATEFTDNLIYFINLIKPAHTIGIVVVDLVGNESYREHWVKTYKKDIFEDPTSEYYQDIDKIFEDYLSSSKIAVEYVPSEATFGYKHFDYPLTFFLNDLGTADDPNSGSKIFGEDSNIKLIGPIFAMSDSSIGALESINSETKNLSSNINLAFKLNSATLNTSPLADAQIVEYYEITPELSDSMPKPSESGKIDIHASLLNDTYNTPTDSKSLVFAKNATENIPTPNETLTSNADRGLSESKFNTPIDVRSSTYQYTPAETFTTPTETRSAIIQQPASDAFNTQTIGNSFVVTPTLLPSEIFPTPTERPMVVDITPYVESSFPTTNDAYGFQMGGSSIAEVKELQSNELTSAFTFNGVNTFNSAQFLYIPIINIANGRMYRVDGQGVETEVIAKAL